MAFFFILIKVASLPVLGQESCPAACPDGCRIPAVDGDEIRFLISGKPDIMDVTVKELYDLPAGLDVVHIGI